MAANVTGEYVMRNAGSVRRPVEAAGFVFVAQSRLLASPGEKIDGPVSNRGMLEHLRGVM